MLADFGFLKTALSIAIIGISILLILVILLQRNRGAGLSGAFGGVGGHSAFGTKTGDMLTWVTVALITVFFLLNISAVFVFEPDKTPSPTQPDISTSETTPPADQPATPQPQP